MNRYPIWKYLVLALTLVIAALYTLPNFFGEAPAVQVSSLKAMTKVDEGTVSRVEEALRAAGVKAEEVVLEGNSVRARLDTPDNQLRAKDAIQKALIPDPANPPFIVALNLVSRSPASAAQHPRDAHVPGPGFARRRALHAPGGYAGGPDQAR